jgi:hypothetical protein
LDQNFNKVFVGDTVFRKVKLNHEQFPTDPADGMFYVVTSIQPDLVPSQGHRYERVRDQVDLRCSYISIDGPDGPYPKKGEWLASNFVFACRGDA